MMDSSERPRRNTGTSELFTCFASHLSSSSSSSMKISSKSILSPGHARDGPVSLSTSLSRRLKTNRSIRGGQSPMFPNVGKRRGSSFENPEPSSPKVTCIGQVRVKTKKQGKKIRTLSKRRGCGEVSSLRRSKTTRDVKFPLGSNLNQQQLQESLPHHRNQRWVHLPLTICEALRGFGAEFSCLFPCRPSCFSNGERGKEEREKGSSERSDGQGSCGAVFGRWLVALTEGEGVKGKEVELVVGGDEEEERREVRERISLKRHVDEEIGSEDEKCEVNDVGFVDEEEGRASICIPPKNALLLMRFRSDPIRMSALANRLSDSPAPECEDDDHEEEENEEVEKSEGLVKNDLRLLEAKEDEESEKLDSTATNEEEQENPDADLVMNAEECEEGEGNPEEENLEVNAELWQEADEEDNQEPEVEAANQELGAEERGLNNSSCEAVTDPEKLETEDTLLIRKGAEAQLEERRESHSSSVVSVHLYSEDEEEEAEALTEEKEEEKAEDPTLKMAVEEEEEEERPVDEKETQDSPLKLEEEEEGEEIVTQEQSESEDTQKEQGSMQSEEREEEEEEEEQEESHSKLERESSSSTLLPDCLLLMRCEPKLSMEVSKETWVCTTDFIRWLPERKKPKAKNGGDEPKKKRVSLDSNPVHYQPQRSSCSLPAAVAGVSMGTMIEQKLAAAYEPLVLPRCKSEPMRTAAAKLKPDTCFWKNRKLEPHRVGVGAAGVGF